MAASEITSQNRCMQLEGESIKLWALASQLSRHAVVSRLPGASWAGSVGKPKTPSLLSTRFLDRLHCKQHHTRSRQILLTPS